MRRAGLTMVGRSCCSAQISPPCQRLMHLASTIESAVRPSLSQKGPEKAAWVGRARSARPTFLLRDGWRQSWLHRPTE
jgi:hypothetical protein